MKAATVSDEKPMTWGRRSTVGEQVKARRDKHGQEKHKNTLHINETQIKNLIWDSAFGSEINKEVAFNLRSRSKDLLEQTFIFNSRH